MANYVWDEKTKRYVMKKTEGASKPASSGNYVSARVAANKQALANDAEWQGRSKTASIRAAVKDLTNNQRFEKYQSQLSENLYKRGGSAGISKIVKGLGDYQQYHKTLMDNIDLFELSDEEREELIGAANAGLEIADNFRNLARARTGDKSVLDGATGDRYKEYERLLKLSGYDQLDAKMQTPLPKEVQKQPTAVVDIPADYDFNVFGDDIFRAKYGAEKDGTKLTEEQRQMYKQRIETVTGIKDFDALSTSEQLNLTYDPDYLDQMQKMNSGAQTYQDVLDITQAYGNEDMATDAMTVRDYQEGHVQVSEDEYNRAKNRLSAIGGGFDLESLFGDLDDLDNYVKYAQAYASQARGDAEQAQFDDQIQQKYGQYQNAPDFAAKSQPISLDREPQNDAEAIHEAIVSIDAPELYETPIKEGGMVDTVAGWLGIDRDKFTHTNTLADPNTGRPSAAQQKYNASTIAPDQRKMFKYLWETHGQDAAMQYLEDIDWSVRKAAAAKTEEVSEELSDGVLGGAAASIASVLASPARAVTTPVNAARTAAGQEIDQYDPIFNVGRASDTIRKNVGGNLDELLGNANILGWNIGSGLYNAAMSAADSWMLAPFGATGAAAAMGLEASDSAMREALANGRTQGEALRDAGVTAGIEFATGKIPMENLFGEVVSPGKYFLTNALSEMGEELASEGLNMLYDTIAYGDESDLGKVVSELRTLGYAGKDLTLAMVKEVAGRMRDAGFGGLAGGGLGAAGRTVTSAAENASIKKNLSGNDAVKPMLNLAETLNLPEDIRNIVQDQLKAVSDGKKVSAAKIGRIFRETMKAVDEKTQSVLSASMSRNVAGMLRGVGVDDPAVADAVTRIVADNGTAGAEDYRMVATNAAALKATEDLVSRYDTGMETQRKADEIAEAAHSKVEKPAQVNNPPEAEEEAEPASETDELTPEEMEAAGIQSDVQIDEQAAKEMVDAAAAEYGRNADIVAAAYEAGQDPVSFNQQFRQAYQYGEEGLNYDVISKSSTFSALNEQQIKKAYLMGRDVRVQRAQEAAKQPVGRVKVGNVDTSKIRNVKLNNYQKAAISAISKLAKAIGFNVEFFASTANADGKFTEKNGSWSKETRTISIDINAGRASTKDVNYAIMQTVGHELTHFIKAFADTELFAQYQDFVMGHLSEKVSEKALDDMVQQYIKRWAENDAVLDRDGAIEEIVADASGDALLKLTEADLQQLAQSNPSLLKKIGDFIQRWVKNTKALIEKAYTGQTARNPIADQMVDAVDELGRKWAELLKNASANAANFTVTNNGAVVSPEVAEIMESGDYSAPDNGLLGEKNSIRETAAWAKSHREQYPDDAAFEQNLALVENFDRNVAADSVARYLVPHGRIPKTVRGPLRNNVEYVYTFDMDTKCERTYQFLAYRDAIQKRIGRQLTEDEARCLIEQMRAYGQMIPCTYCYVEGKRMKLAELYMKYLSKNSESVMGQKYSAEEVFDIVETARSVVSGYLDNRFNVEDNYTLDTTLASGDFAGYRDFEMPISEEAAAQEIYDRYNITDKSAKRVVAGFVAEWVYSRRMDVPQNLVNADVDFESAGIDERVLAFHDLATKAAQGGAKAKGIENYEPYVDQLKNVSVEDKKYMVGMGGIRKHSSNDFQIQNVQDYMLFFMDLAADKRGGVDWTGHTYTKNLDYARIFAPTNDRINVSIAMYGDNTSGITPNTQEGVEWEELKQVRKQYKNVGAMAMVTNNDQLSFALNSSWIDMIIPFHASGMKRSLYYDVLAWTDYTSKQSERLYTKGQMIDKLREKGVKVNSSAKAADVLNMFMENFDVKVVYNEKTGKRVAPHFFPGETIQHGVKIPGHGNDAQRYFELCEQYGTNPRFFGVKVQDAGGKIIDVTQHPSYLKLIKETARTDTPQQPIVAKFDMDYVNEAMSRFRGYSNLSEDAYGIVDEFVREYAGKKRKVGYLTERAQQYKEIRAEMAAEEAAKRAAQREELTAAINAVENAISGRVPADGEKLSVGRGNDRQNYGGQFAETAVKEKFEAQTDTRQFRNWFNGSKIKNPDGTPKVMYHGTSSYGFNAFDTYGGRYGLMGMGSYFTDNREVAEGYTKKGRGSNPGIYEVYLSVKNPIDMDAKAGSKLARAWDEYFNEYLLSDSKITGDMTNEQILRVVEEALRYDGTMTVSEVAELFDGFYRSQGFDGITHIGGGRFGADNGVRHQVVIAFEPEQVKSATDNIGTFDPNDADIHHQLRDPDQISDRELLANVMESAAENAAELDFVRRYRKQLDQLDQKQADMEAAHAEMIAARKAGKKDEAIKLKNKVDILAKQIDRMDGQLLKFEAGKPLQAVVKRQREQLREKANERIKKRVEKVRQQEAEKRDELRARIDTLRQEKNRKIEQLRQEKIQKVKEVRDEKNESFARQKYLDEVKKSAGKLREMVTSPTNKKHVPQVLRQPIADFLTALDFTSAQQLNGGEATKADNQLENAMLKMKDALQKVQNSQNGLDTSGAEYFSGYMDLPAGYAETFDQIIGKVRAAIAASDGINGTPINRMKSADLHELAKHLRMLHTAINNMNSLIANAKYATAIAASQDTIADLESIKAKKDQNALFQKLSDFIDWKNSVPYYAFQRMGRGGKAIFEALMDGWDKLAFNAEELVKFTESVYNAKEVKAWESEIKTVELESGESVRMTAAQLMSLYCLAKREQALGHLMGGGIRIADIEGKRGKRIAQGENYILSEGDISKFRNALTDRQREVADALQADMVKRGGDWGNEISMRRFGYNMFTEANYFPVESDSNNLKAKDPNAQENSLLRLLNMSATKDLVKGANNAIVVRSIFDVYTAHMSDMAKYNALGLQILDMMKWLNYVERTEEVDANGNSTGRITTESVQKSLELAYGTEARRYIMEFIKNLNGDVEGGREDIPINKFTSNYKIAAVGANLRVGFLQITSLPRAATVIDTKYLLKGIAKWNAKRGDTSKQATAKVGIAKWKSMGFYDTNISRNMRQMIKHDETAIEKVREGSMKLAELGDAWTMGVLYGAVESELMQKERNLAPGTDAWNKRVNERMREIIYRTQVVDSTMTRSHLMRQKGAISGALAFMSEPTLTLNMMNDALFESRMSMRRGEKWNPAVAKNVAKVFAVSAVVSGLAAFMEAAFTAMRDDDEFETIAEKYLDALWGDYSDAETYGDKLSAFFGSALGGKLNPLSNIPVISDIIDAWKNGAEKTLWQAFAGEMGEGYRALMKVIREGGTLADYYRAGYKMLSGLSKASGIPASNAVRDLVSIYNTFAAEPMGWKRIQTYDNTKKEAAEAYYDAIVKGDSNRAGFILERAEISGLSAADVADATATLIKEDYIGGRISESEARQYLSKYAKRSTDKIDTNMRDWGYQRNTGLKYSDMKRDYLDGLITKSQAQTLLMQYRGYDSEEVYWQLSKWDYEKTTGEEGGKYSWFLAAVDDGYGYEKRAQDLLNHGVNKSDIAGAIAGEYKKAYLEIKGTPEGDRMLEYLLDVYESIGYDREYERDYITKKWN